MDSQIANSLPRGIHEKQEKIILRRDAVCRDRRFSYTSTRMGGG